MALARALARIGKTHSSKRLDPLLQSDTGRIKAQAPMLSSAAIFSGLSSCLGLGFEGPLASLLPKQGNNTLGQVITAAELSMEAWALMWRGLTRPRYKRAKHADTRAKFS